MKRFLVPGFLSCLSIVGPFVARFRSSAPSKIVAMQDTPIVFEPALFLKLVLRPVVAALGT